MISFSHAAFVNYSSPSKEGSQQENIWVASLGVGVQRVDGATVRNTLDPDLGVDTMEGVRHKVTVGLRAYSSS